MAFLVPFPGGAGGGRLLTIKLFQLLEPRQRRNRRLNLSFVDILFFFSDYVLKLVKMFNSTALPFLPNTEIVHLQVPWGRQRCLPSKSHCWRSRTREPGLRWRKGQEAFWGGHGGGPQAAASAASGLLGVLISGAFKIPYSV